VIRIDFAAKETKVFKIFGSNKKVRYKVDADSGINMNVLSQDLNEKKKVANSFGFPQFHSLNLRENRIFRK
jgi:hypothetical protein